MLKFKNVGTLDVKLTELEKANGLYDIPRLAVGDKILVNLPSPKMSKSVVNTSWYVPADSEACIRLYQELVCEPYCVVGIHSYNVELVEDTAGRIKYRPSEKYHDCYHLVKKRNYNKYLMQLLADHKKIDYIIVKPCGEIDKALNLGFIELI